MIGPDDEIVENPQPETVEAAVRGLDGVEKTQLVLQDGDEGPQLGIGGGDGRFIVYFTPDNLDFWNLIDPDAQDVQEWLTCAGQSAEYPKRQITNTENAVKAAVHFAATGKMAPNIDWEQQASLD